MTVEGAPSESSAEVVGTPAEEQMIRYSEWESFTEGISEDGQPGDEASFDKSSFSQGFRLVSTKKSQPSIVLLM